MNNHLDICPWEEHGNHVGADRGDVQRGRGGPHPRESDFSFSRAFDKRPVEGHARECRRGP